MGLICSLLQLYVIVIIAGALLSWFPTEPGGGLHQVRVAIARVTDPVMLPVRRAIGTSFGGIDFSPLIVIIGLQLLAGIIC
ncbi:MAG TPA: YggT family protein [Acidimicrobiales bacterium]|nr:YggT family protein [Acidimicrobiales bacterium]